jgi:hypothetical protein
MLSTNNSKTYIDVSYSYYTPTSKNIQRFEDILFAPKKKKNEKKDCSSSTYRTRRKLMFQYSNN